MRATAAPSTPQIRLHPDAAAVEVQALFRGVVISSRCLVSDQPAAFLIGSARGVDTPVATSLLAGDAHSLITNDARGFTIDLTEQMTGTVIFEDHSAPLAELLRTQGPQFVPPPAARVQISCGEVAFLVTPTAPPTTVPRAPARRLDEHWALALSAAALLLMLTLVAFIPPETRAISGDNLADLEHQRTVIAIPPVLPSRAPAGPRLPGGSGGGPGTKPIATPTPHRPIASHRPPATPRGRAPVDVRQTGVLGVLASAQGHSWEGIFSHDQVLDPASLRDLIGDGGGPGRIGLGTTGTGAGPGYGPLIGAGPAGTIGGCGPACQEGIRVGTLTKAKLEPHPIHGPEIIPQPAVVRGSLDKEIVRRTIRRHLNEVKFCYERELLRRPSLAGRLSVQFTIAPAGNVLASAVQSSTLDNATVESCVTQAVQRWSFPHPQGGGVVVVSYPFVMVPAGAL
jgi:hypothetical protein